MTFLREFAKRYWLVVIWPAIGAVASIGTVAPFLGIGDTGILYLRVVVLVAAVTVILWIAYDWGRFLEGKKGTVALNRRIADCCRFVRFGPHAITFDVRLVNMLVRSASLRSNQVQWSIGEVNHDAHCLILNVGSDRGIMEGLVFSVTKRGNGASRYRIQQDDLTRLSTRLRPANLALNAQDRPGDFFIDLVDPNEAEIGHAFEMERFIAQVLTYLDAD